MPPAARPRRHPTDDWSQRRLLVASPAQETYELLRPIVLFGQPPAVRARETGVPERTLRRKAARFDDHGKHSLFELDPPPPEPRRRWPAAALHVGIGLRDGMRRLRLTWRPVGHRCDPPA